MDLMCDISNIKGVGEKTAKYLNKLGVYTFEDILLFFPRTYYLYPDIEPLDNNLVGKEVAIAAKINIPAKVIHGKKMDITSCTAYCCDNNIPLDLIWFRAPYIRSQLNVNETYIFVSKLLFEHNHFKMEMSKIFTVDQYISLKNGPQPVYHLTRGLNNNLVKKIINDVFKQINIDDNRLPEAVEENLQLMPYSRALFAYHFPKDYQQLIEARRRLAYEELFYFILNTRLSEKNTVSVENKLELKNDDCVEDIKSKLPFKLTVGQSEALEDIKNDIRSSYVTQRLIQGDVGSGKTMVAFLAMLDVISNGYQAVIMAPTEVLAVQHYETFIQYTKNFGLDYPVALFTGSMKASQRKKMQAIVDENDAVFIVGTHALISDKTNLRQVGLVVCDEQHRFGVAQREKLSKKGIDPHMIVMSATPIPRTLAMILYGNMHVSVIKELPANRLPVKTCVIKDNMRPNAYKFISDEISKGHQCYVICPLVEATETTEAENVIDFAKKLEDYFEGKYKIEYLHGKMKNDEKNDIMNSFADGKTDILVSTTVVEVGVNVVNATVIMIENANRFGLAQLHQLRGRVGRGADQSYCILMDSASDSKDSKRLEVMLKTNDGFEISREDLKLRGPGDFFGVRQSGEFSFKIADIYNDSQLLEIASKDVDELLKKDPDLNQSPMIKNALTRFIINQSYVL
ncbi:MAG: ATP-dependent DNA helicase RecG [Pseudobutyrivibrio sp.]|nr:ATP-dependent DNA helicase RecG [Pseudobutyrivibrio sp.]